MLTLQLDTSFQVTLSRAALLALHLQLSPSLSSRSSPPDTSTLTPPRMSRFRKNTHLVFPVNTLVVENASQAQQIESAIMQKHSKHLATELSSHEQEQYKNVVKIRLVVKRPKPSLLEPDDVAKNVDDSPATSQYPFTDEESAPSLSQFEPTEEEEDYEAKENRIRKGKEKAILDEFDTENAALPLIFTGDEEIDELESDAEPDFVGPPQSVYTSEGEDAFLYSLDQEKGDLTEDTENTDYDELEEDELEDDDDDGVFNGQISMIMGQAEPMEQNSRLREYNDDDWKGTVQPILDRGANALDTVKVLRSNSYHMKKILPYRVSKKAAGIKKRKDIRDITPSNVEETKDIRRVSSFRGKVTKASNKCEKRIMCVAEHTLVGPGHVYSYNWRPIGHVCGCTSSTISIHTRHILRNHLGGGKITYKPSVKAWCDKIEELVAAATLVAIANPATSDEELSDRISMALKTQAAIIQQATSQKGLKKAKAKEADAAVLSPTAATHHVYST